MQVQLSSLCRYSLAWWLPSLAPGPWSHSGPAGSGGWGDADAAWGCALCRACWLERTWPPSRGRKRHPVGHVPRHSPSPGPAGAARPRAQLTPHSPQDPSGGGRRPPRCHGRKGASPPSVGGGRAGGTVSPAHPGPARHLPPPPWVTLTPTPMPVPRQSGRAASRPLGPQVGTGLSAPGAGQPRGYPASGRGWERNVTGRAAPCLCIPRGIGRDRTQPRGVQPAWGLRRLPRPSGHPRDR